VFHVKRPRAMTTSRVRAVVAVVAVAVAVAAVRVAKAARPPTAAEPIPATAMIEVGIVMAPGAPRLQHPLVASAPAPRPS